jgi:amino acid adenylation domain-containing protein
LAHQTRSANSEQLDLWLAADADRESARYNVPVALDFAARPDEEALRAALRQVFDRHPALRSTVRMDESGRLRLEVAEPADPPLRVRQASGPMDRAAREAWAARVGLAPLRLETSGTARADLLMLPAGAVLVLTVHHIVMDGWSVDVMIEDLLGCYDACVAATQADLGAAHDAPPDTAVETAALDYWLDLLADDPDVLEPLPDLVRTAGPSIAAREEALIDGADLATLRAQVRQGRVSMAATGLAAWSTVLHQWSDRRVGVLMTPFSARADPATHRTIGLLSRTLPVRSDFDPARSWVECQQAMHLQLLESFESSAVDTGALRDAVAARGRRYPAARCIYTHLSEPRELRVAPDVAVSRIDVDLRTVKYDTSLAVIEGPEGLRLQLDYDATVYRPDSARAMVRQLRGLLLAAADPRAGLGELLRRADGDSGAVGRWDDAPPDLSRTPPELVVAVARADPDRPAVIEGDRRLTYAELVASASRLARWLLAAGEDEPLVGVLLPGSTDAVVAFLGIALAGKAYVPLDPDQPDARLSATVEDAGLARMITTEPLLERARGLGCAAVTVAAALEAAAHLPAGPPDVALGPEDLLNVLYTSGSTGRPKGVMLPHRGVARLLGAGTHLQLGEGDRVAQLCSLNFDGATFEIWGALGRGAAVVVLDRTLVLAPAELREAVRRFGVTALIITTPVFHSLVTEAPELLQSLTLVSLGGDVAAVGQVARGLAWSGPGVLAHTYGPTENSFTSLVAPVDEVVEGSRALPIGRCVPGTQAYVVRDGTLELAPIGACGELLLGGEGLALGYLGDPRRTAASFVPDPFGDRPGRRLYRTGDRVRRLTSGEVEFIGRTDEQVKIRSQRIELGEVRAAVLRDPGVREAHVDVWRNERGEKEIAAYVVLAAGTTSAALRDRLAAVLPAAAVPTRWAEVDVLPLTANDQVDRDRLPAPALLGAAAAVPAARGPRATTRPRSLDSIRAAWREVLDDPAVGDDVNFFDAGGHSLLLARLQAALRSSTGVEVRIADLFRFPSIRAQAELLAGDGADRTVAAPAAAAWNAEPIAVIGAACRFAGASDVRAFWRNLASDCVSGAGVVPVELGDGRRRVSRWGMLDVPRAFDAELFGLTPEEARTTDPQHGLLHECLWAAMEDAALTLDRLRDRTSIYAGCGNPVGGPVDAGLTAAFTSQPSFAASRYAYRHDLRGESVMLDTACSTSLVAVHLASAALRAGTSDYAFAGGVSVSDPAGAGYVYEPGLVYADDGVCRPFDEAATGTTGGDGGGVVLLRRLSDALRDGDPIHAVLLGSAVNNDGHARAGYAAPGANGQISVIRDALAAAGVEGSEIGFVETHGTGTRLGDAIEATALAEAIGERAEPLPISSVKSAIGHCNTAAGVAGLLTAAHAVRDHALPGTVNSANPIGEITDGARLRLLTATEKWEDSERPRIAGVSSFGIGGTNAHVVVGEFVAQQAGAQ